MVWKRFTAFCLAAAMMAANVADVALLAAPFTSNARASGDVEAATLGFIKKSWDDDKDHPERTTVVSGGSVDLSVSIKSGYEENKETSFNYDSTDGTAPKDDDIVITGTGKTRRLDVSDSFPAIDKAIDKQTVMITGNYYAIKGQGKALEKINGADRTKIDATVDPERIMQYGELTIKATQGEIVANGKSQGGATFTVTAPEFLSNGGAENGLYGYDGGTVGSRRADNGDLIVEIYPPAGTAGRLDDLTFTITPSKAYEYFVTPDKQNSAGTNNFYLKEDGTPYADDELLDNGLPPVKTMNDVIQKDEEITFYLDLPKSNTLLLTVIKATAAVEEIANDIKISANRNDEKFIKLDPGDALNWITTDFSLRNYQNQYNDKFTISWDWKADDSAYQDNVHIGESNNEWIGATIEREITDVKGKLLYTVTFKDRNGKETKSAQQEIDIVIRGTGDPPVATLTAQWLNKDDLSSGVNDDANKIPMNTELNNNGTQLKMDVYKGGVIGYKNPQSPYRYEITASMGARQSWAKYMIIDASGSTDAVTVQLNTTSGIQDYTFGSEFNNPSISNKDTAVNIPVQINAAKPGTVTLTFRFFVEDSKGNPVELDYKPRVTITVVDTSPSEDATLSSLVMKDPKGQSIDFGFTPEATQPFEIKVPFKTESITLEAFRNDDAANKMIAYYAYHRDGGLTPVYGTEDNPEKVEAGKPTDKIPLTENVPVYIEVTVTAQNPNFTKTYTLQVTRTPASTDATLSNIEIYDESDTDMKNNYLKDFNPLQMDGYMIEVPYKTDWLRVKVPTTDPNAAVQCDPKLENKVLFGDPEWIRLSKMTPNDQGVYVLKVKVVSEQSIDRSANKQPDFTKPDREYTVQIRRRDPSDVSTLTELKVYDTDDKQLTLSPAFTAAQSDYTLRVPFSTSKIRASVKPQEDSVSRIFAVYGRRGQSDYKKWKTVDINPDGSISKDIPVDFITAAYDHDEIWIVVGSEMAYGYTEQELIKMVIDGDKPEYVSVYRIRVERAEPSDDATLKSLVINDQDGVDTKKISFNPDVETYEISVPYETREVSFVPTANHEGARIKIQSSRDSILPGVIPPRWYTVNSGTASKNFDLPYAVGDATTTFTIRVEAENYDYVDPPSYKEYIVKITREEPSHDAYLKALSATNTENWQPDPFIRTTLNYEATVKEGSSTVTITATTYHPGATLTINGMAAQSGVASDPIDLVDIYTTIEIVVTAQDGTTKMTYTIEFYNQNLVEKTNNADLRSLKVNYGLMTPNFKPAVTEYEVTATEDTYSVDIIPRTDDRLATYEVFAGTRKIGDYNNNYALALEDGENEVRIVVTSPDKTVTKEYTVMIYRNEEDKLKNLTPLESEDVDYEGSGDTIIIMIDQYPRIGASVFEELKNYPDKTIIFQGNDYSLEFKASDLAGRVIPSTEIYDFRMSFSPPDEQEDAIWDIIESRSGNDDLTSSRVVMAYFPHHGSLPATAILHMSIGKRYGNETIYWHYYNEERDRIDYYGPVQTNAQGTFAVKIDHFSTYVMTERHSIVGAELRVGETTLAPDGGFLNDAADIVKVNPSTGAAKECK